MKFNILIAVWGPSYVASLCKITLPSLVPSVDKRPAPDDQWKILIYTRSEEEDSIRSHLFEFASFAEIVFFHIEPANFANHYLAMANAHNLGAKLTIQDGARGIIVPPDAVFSANALSVITSVAKSGKRAMMIVGPRLRETTAFEAITSLLASDPQIPPRKLAALGLRHLHPEMRRYFWSSDDFSTLPFMCCWDAPGGWLSRNFHLHPLMIDFSVEVATEVLKRDTIDGEFLGETIGIWDDIHVVQDSDELLVFTLTPDDVFYSFQSPESASVSTLRKTAYDYGMVNPLHRWFFTKAIKIHADDLDRRWKTLEEQTGHLCFDILSIKKADPAPVESEEIRQEPIQDEHEPIDDAAPLERAANAHAPGVFAKLRQGVRFILARANANIGK